MGSIPARRAIEVLCNGSTTDFDSVCRGSNPCTSTNFAAREVHGLHARYIGADDVQDCACGCVRECVYVASLVGSIFNRGAVSSGAELVS